jgi:response regulator RpfG family c-di-GMP phosphodiesterase
MEIHRRKGESLVLVVDDEQEGLSSLADLLRGEFSVAVTSDSSEVPELPATIDVALLMTDQRMPVVSGAQPLESCASLSPSITRVLIMSYSDIEDVVESVSEGRVYHYASKFWESERLPDVIRRGVEKHKLESECQCPPSKVEVLGGSDTAAQHRASGGSAFQKRTRGALKSVGDLVQAFEHLRGVIPICMYCHKIQVNDNDWSHVVEFLESRSTVLSHGVCPSCSNQLIFGAKARASGEDA